MKKLQKGYSRFSNQFKKGFTLIKMVLVVAILGLVGIVAALELPQFVNLSAQERVSSVKAAKKYLWSSSATAHWMFSIEMPRPETVKEGSVIIPLASTVPSGYPKASMAFAKASGLAASDLGASDIDYAITVAGATLTVSPASASAEAKKAGTCSVVYTEPKEVDTVPTFVVNTDGC